MKNFRPLFRSTVNYWLITSILAIIALLSWRFLHSNSPMERISIAECLSDSLSLSSDSLHINYANATELSRFGFRSGVIVNMLKYRDAGGTIRNMEHLLKMRGIDSSLIAEKGHLIAFNRPTVIRNYDYSAPKPTTKYVRKPHTRRIGLYYTPVDTLIAMGINSQIIDSIMAYRERYIVRGSITLDSLLNTSPLSFAQIMSSHISQRIVWQNDPSHQHKPSNRICIDINTASAKELCSIVGIAEKTATRIIERRVMLGGFVHKSQLMEINTIDSARYAQIEPQFYISASSVSRLRINEATKEEVLAHPYMRKELGRQLLRLRYRHKKLSREMVSLLLNGSLHDQWLLEYLEF